MIAKTWPEWLSEYPAWRELKDDADREWLWRAVRRSVREQLESAPGVRPNVRLARQRVWRDGRAVGVSPVVLWLVLQLVAMIVRWLWERYRETGELP